MSTTSLSGTPLPTHHAALQVTGWLHECRGQWGVQQWPVQLNAAGRTSLGQRVALLARPRTDLWGNLTDRTVVQHLSVAPARRPNGTRFCALGQLRRVDPSEQLVILRTFKNGSHGHTLSLRFRATETVLRGIDPDWWTLQVRGSVVGRTLIAETGQRPFTGPLAPRWADEWHLVPGVDPRAFPELIDRPLPPSSVVRRSPAGRCDLNGKPLKRDAFEVLLRAGSLWAS